MDTDSLYLTDVVLWIEGRCSLSLTVRVTMVVGVVGK